MRVNHIAAFAHGQRGGHLSGVVLCKSMPATRTMQRIASGLGSMETTFASPHQDGWHVRSFSAGGEVGLSDSAAVATTVALARECGDGEFTLYREHGHIEIEGRGSGGRWLASFLSAPTRSTPASQDVLDEALALFGLNPGQLDQRIPPAIAHAGGDHLVLAISSRETLNALRYERAWALAFAEREWLTTFSLIHAQDVDIFHARSPAPMLGSHENPSTGAAAAALAGYLRDIEWAADDGIAVIQGNDVAPCRLWASIPRASGRGVQVTGEARFVQGT